MGRQTSVSVQDRPLDPAVLPVWVLGLYGCSWLCRVTVWVHPMLRVIMTVAHDVLCSTDVCELVYPAMYIELCVCFCTFSWLVYILVYSFVYLLGV